MQLIPLYFTLTRRGILLGTLLGLLLGLLLLTPAYSSANSILTQFKWLAGCWRYSDYSEGSEEHWMMPVGNLMPGMSRTLRPNRPGGFEFLRIEADAQGQIYYVAQPQGGSPVRFLLTDHSGSRWKFENPQHDFPQQILYESVSEDRTNAVISGRHQEQVQSVNYAMQRIDCPH